VINSAEFFADAAAIQVMGVFHRNPRVFHRAVSVFHRMPKSFPQDGEGCLFSFIP
jgi:hypothetical protein